MTDETIAKLALNLTKVAKNGFMTCVSGDGDPYVKTQFSTLNESHEFHSTLIAIYVAVQKTGAWEDTP